MLLNRRFGPYILLERLAIGGMAELYLALKLGPGPFEKFVVIKKILPYSNEDPDFVRLFYREAELSAQLHHPNVVHTYDCDVLNGTHYLVMECMEGVTVAEMAERGAEIGLSLPQDFAVRIIIDACEGLGYVHSLTDDLGAPLGVVHRDISPQNVFITFDGIGKVFDFGIASFARDRGAGSQAGMLAGKYAYMSPEQCRGKEVDCRSDIFSLGIILYELTTGYRLYKRDDQILTLRAITEDDIPPPSALVPRYPPFLERIVYKALERDRDARYATALELADDLRKFLRVNGSKPSQHHLGAYLERLFADDMRARGALRKKAVEEAEKLFGRSDPLGELLASRPAATGSFNAIDIELTPDEGPIEAAPQAMPPREVHTPDRPTGPQRLAAVVVAEQDEPSVVTNGRALAKAQRINRVLAIIALLAIVAGTIAVLYFVRKETTKGPAETEKHEAKAPATSGKVRITSTPIGADIYVNGDKREQRTPAEIDVPFGQSVEFEIRAEGYAPYKKAVTLAEGQERYVVQAKLKDAADVLPEEITTAVRVVTTPPGAKVVFDGHPLEGLTPVVIPEAQVGVEHVLVFDADEHETLIFSFTPSSTTEMELELELRPVSAKKLGTLIIDSWPRGARVEFDQKYAGITPLPVLRMEARVDHMLLLRLGTLEPYLETITLAPGEARSVSPRLSEMEEEAIDPELSEDAAHITISSEPPADVRIDSREVGRTPLENVAVLPGTHWIEFRDEAKGIRHVEVASFHAKEQSTVKVTIPRGRLIVECEAPAQVQVDGTALGATPIDTVVFVGNHAVKLTAEGFEKTVAAQVQPGKTATVKEKCSL